MIKAIILDDGYHSKDVVVKFGKNYKCVSLVYFLNSLCKRHNSDYLVRTAYLEDIENDVEAEWFETLSNMSLHACVVYFYNLKFSYIYSILYIESKKGR